MHNDKSEGRPHPVQADELNSPDSGVLEHLVTSIGTIFRPSYYTPLGARVEASLLVLLAIITQDQDRFLPTSREQSGSRSAKATVTHSTGVPVTTLEANACVQELLHDPHMARVIGGILEGEILGDLQKATFRTSQEYPLLSRITRRMIKPGTGVDESSTESHDLSGLLRALGSVPPKYPLTRLRQYALPWLIDALTDPENGLSRAEASVAGHLWICAPSISKGLNIHWPPYFQARERALRNFAELANDSEIAPTDPIIKFTLAFLTHLSLSKYVHFLVAGLAQSFATKLSEGTQYHWDEPPSVDKALESLFSLQEVISLVRLGGSISGVMNSAFDEVMAQKKNMDPVITRKVLTQALALRTSKVDHQAFGRGRNDLNQRLFGLAFKALSEEDSVGLATVGLLMGITLPEVVLPNYGDYLGIPGVPPIGQIMRMRLLSTFGIVENQDLEAASKQRLFDDARGAFDRYNSDLNTLNGWAAALQDANVSPSLKGAALRLATRLTEPDSTFDRIVITPIVGSRDRTEAEIARRIEILAAKQQLIGKTIRAKLGNRWGKYNVADVAENPNSVKLIPCSENDARPSCSTYAVESLLDRLENGRWSIIPARE